MVLGAGDSLGSQVITAKKIDDKSSRGGPAVKKFIKDVKDRADKAIN